MKKKDDLKKKLKQKKLTIGSWLSWGSGSITEIMAKAGFDWLVIDMEHTCIDYSDAQQMIQIIDLASCTPLVRVGSNDPLIIKRVLDCGAKGIIVPMVNTVDDAKKAVSSAYYPPRGNRGVGLSRAQGYGLEFNKYRKTSIEETVVLVQIEHIEGVENLEFILDVDGVDGFIVGPYDLSGSVGQPGDFEHPDVREAFSKISQIIKNSKKPGGIHIVHTRHNEIRGRIDEGYRFIAYGDDMVIFAEKIKEISSFIDSIH